MKTSDVFKANEEATEAAEAARETAQVATREALFLARRCRVKKDKEGNEILPSEEDKQKARDQGKVAAMLRKNAKEKEAEAASARRIACFKAMPAKPAPPPLVLPLKPPIAKPWED